MKIKNIAFTLAEVLITVGIIGVVSALTIPTLTHYYQKKAITTKLRTTDAQLKQCFRHSVAENGDMNTWTQQTFSDIGISNYAGKMDAFIEKYMMPYFSGAKYDKKTKTLAQYGFVNGIKYPDGTYAASPSDKWRVVQLNNGVILIFAITSLYDSKSDTYNMLSFIILAALNGASKQATIGKDVFVFATYFADNNFTTFNCALFKSGTTECYYDNTNRAKQLAYCKKGDVNSEVCGDVIRMDDWKIAKDYPWL